ncbi:multidrug transporter [Paenibacillus oryzae]|uniref:Multidrug transporter n=1 Tax=Paenibacillus oryzae TaxID=1844972 RepID=A0A1A5YEG7_9BACL|nr:MFS transporter [Paenibacillus oryzae]OBR63795.1 multidrug transporter [Paenibacillus oryzae]
MSLLLRNRGAVLLLMLNIFIVFTGIGLIVPIMPSYMNMLHIGGSTLGFLVAAFSIAQLIFSPLAGRISDSIGRKKVIVAGMLLFAVSEWMFGAVSALPLLFLSRLLGGISAALVMPAVMAYTADITTDEERGKGMGLINAAITTGFIIGPGIGGYIAEFGIRVPFYAAAVAGIVAMLITAFLLPETPALQQQENSASRTAGVKQPVPSLLRQLASSYREPYFISLIVVLIASFGLANFETVFGLFVDHKFGFTPKDIAFIITFGSIAGAVVQLTIFGWIINRFGEKNVITVSLFSAALFVLLGLLVHTFWLIVAVTFALFLAIDILRPAIGTQMSKFANQQQGYVAGLNSAFTSLGNIIGPIIGGFLFDQNLNFPYMMAGLILALGFVMSFKSQKVPVHSASSTSMS